MKSVFYTMMLLCVCFSAKSQVVTLEEAQRGASKFLSRELGKEVFCKVQNSLKNDYEDCFYVLTTTKDDNNFILVSKNKKAYPVIAFSTESGYDENNMPPAVKLYLKSVNEQLAYFFSKDFAYNQDLDDQWTMFLNTGEEPSKGVAVSPIVSTKWNQDYPYNAKCPADAEAASAGRCYAGCVATAMGQVMKYHGYPEKGIGSSEYETVKYGKLTANYGSTTYLWDSMPNSISSTSPQTQIDAVAQLLYDIGVSVEMNYGPTGSGAMSEVSATSLERYFGYSSYATEIDRSQYDDNTWVNVITDELLANRPLVYRGSANDGSNGHAFVCDGVTAGGKLHFNFGWSGSYDGNYSVTSLAPGGGQGAGDFTYYQSAIFRLEPAELPAGELYCNEMTTLTSASDTVRDGSGDNRYAAGSYCKWLIKPETATTSITINFKEFSIDAGSNVVIYAGSSATGTPLKVLTGFTLPDEIVVDGNSALVILEAEDYSRAGGFTFVYSSTVGIEEAWNNNEIKVFPIPAENQLTIAFSSSTQEIVNSIEIIDILGQTVLLNNNIQTSNIFDVSSLQQGVYFLKLVGNDETVVKKIEIR